MHLLLIDFIIMSTYFTWTSLVTTIIGVSITALAIRFAKADCDWNLLNKSLKKDAFRGKVVWITGASSGIGEALANAFCLQGAKLILTARRKSELQRVRDNLPGAKSSNSVYILCMDLSDLDSIEEKTKEAWAAFGHIDVLVNNAGVSTRDLAVAMTHEVDEKVIRLNYLSPVRLTKALLPNMIDRKDGHIVNISSLAGKSGVIFRTAYCGSKFALIGFMDALRLETCVDGIRVTNICPGYVKTNVSVNALTGSGAAFGSMDDQIAAGMAVERCAELILTAIANSVDEAWVSDQPVLTASYIFQYAPSLGRWIQKKRTAKVLSEYRESRTIGF